MPPAILHAVREVGESLELAQNWLNAGPAGLIDFGLPDGLADRVTVLRYGALEVHVPGRSDLIHFKLYAAVDQGERSKHFSDLQALTPARDQLVAAARWTRTHDPSVGFLGELRRILAVLGIEVGDDDF